MAEHEKEKQRRQQWNLWDETTKAKNQQSLYNDTSETDVADGAHSYDYYGILSVCIHRENSKWKFVI